MRREKSGIGKPWLLPIIIALVVQKAALTTATKEDRTAQPKTYLFPMLRFGPNNQKRDLRHTLAVAKYLDCGLVLTGIWKHYYDIKNLFVLDNATAHTSQVRCFKERVPNFLELEEVLDRRAIEQWLPVANVSELKAAGWNGELDAVMYTQNWWHLGRRDIAKALQASGVSVAKDAEHISLPKFMNCDEGMVATVKNALGTHRFVGVVFVLLSEQERPRIHKELTQEPPQPCKKVLYQADRLLHPSPWIKEVALAYVQKHLGGEPYLAMHVRPYPDSCVEEWRSGVFDPVRLKRHCHGALLTLQERVVPCAKKLMQASNLTRLFVMTHPVIRDVVDSILQTGGLDAHYLDMQSVSELAGCTDRSSTFMAMVEEQVAVHADTLLGTVASSITQTIAYERMGNNVHKNYYFEVLH